MLLPRGHSAELGSLQRAYTALTAASNMIFSQKLWYIMVSSHGFSKFFL